MIFLSKTETPLLRGVRAPCLVRIVIRRTAICHHRKSFTVRARPSLLSPCCLSLLHHSTSHEPFHYDARHSLRRSPRQHRMLGIFNVEFSRPSSTIRMASADLGDRSLRSKSFALSVRFSVAINPYAQRVWRGAMQYFNLKCLEIS